MSSTLTDAAIILSREAWREADKRVVFFTSKHGKIDGVAVGAHKIRSKLAGHLEPIRVVDVMMAQGKQGYKIAQCVTNHNFIKPGCDIERVKMMGGIVRLVLRATEAQHPDNELYQLLFKSLSDLEQASDADLSVVYGKYLCAFAEYFGYAPMFAQCVVCGEREDFQRFSAHLGGVLCKKEVVFEKTMQFENTEKSLYRYAGALLSWRGLF